MNNTQKCFEKYPRVTISPVAGDTMTFSFFLWLRWRKSIALKVKFTRKKK
jgi:hypothetical protein